MLKESRARARLITGEPFMAHIPSWPRSMRRRYKEQEKKSQFWELKPKINTKEKLLKNRKKMVRSHLYLHARNIIFTAQLMLITPSKFFFLTDTNDWQKRKKRLSFSTLIALRSISFSFAGFFEEISIWNFYLFFPSEHRLRLPRSFSLSLCAHVCACARRGGRRVREEKS